MALCSRRRTSWSSAGAMGASVACHLRELGVTDVVLLERDSLASGSTSKSAGGIRAQFADELNVRIALRSLDEFERMDGHRLRASTATCSCSTPRPTSPRFREALALQHSLGVPSRELTLGEAPRSSRSSTRTACSRRRSARSTATRRRSRSCSATRAGLDVRQSCAATGIDVERRPRRGVETTRGRIATGTVVCCAGVWSREVAALAGVDLPVAGEPRSCASRPRTAGCPSRCR